MAEDVADGGDGAAVGGCGAERVEGVGEGVRLELEADLDDVEGCDDEAGKVEGVVSRKTDDSWRGRGRREAYRETRPAMAPAVTTCSLEPSSLRRSPLGDMHTVAEGQVQSRCGRARLN